MWKQWPAKKRAKKGRLVKMKGGQIFDLKNALFISALPKKKALFYTPYFCLFFFEEIFFRDSLFFEEQKLVHFV